MVQTHDLSCLEIESPARYHNANIYDRTLHLTSHKFALQCNHKRQESNNDAILKNDKKAHLAHDDTTLETWFIPAN